NHHTIRGGEHTLAGIDHLDEAPDHHLSGLEVGDNAFLQRPDRLDVLMGFLVHLHGLTTNSQHLVGCLVDSDDRRFVNYNFVAVDDEGVSCAKVDRDVTGEKIKKSHGA